MARQFSVFLTNKDVVNLGRVLGGTLPLYAACFESTAPDLSWDPELDPARLQCRSRTLVLVSPEYAGQVIVKHPTTGAVAYYVDSLRSPVVECTLSAQTEGILRAGRFYYQEGYFGEGGAKILKAPSFRRWAEELFELVKRQLTRDPTLGGAYVGQDARTWASDPSHSLRLI
jgi:hypothetical protein